MQEECERSDLEEVKNEMKSAGVDVTEVTGSENPIVGAIGNSSGINKEKIGVMPGVEKILPVHEPYRRANRKLHPQNSVVKFGGVEIGGDAIGVIAGPCSVESREQVIGIAEDVKKSGAAALRGGAFKPRTSPYSFQGLEHEGIDLLVEAREATGLPIVSELMSVNHIELFEEYVDLIQIGARNMQNFDLLKEVGKATKPVLLKRGLSNSIEEWLMSAEYIMAAGNENVILCERGIRTFETFTRNTLDISAILAVKSVSHLPIVIDPSHATGKSWMVEKLSMAAIAAGADGLLIEVHNDPVNALCDGPQSLTPEVFDGIMNKLGPLAAVVGRTINI